MKKSNYREIWSTPIGEYWLEDISIHEELIEHIKLKYQNWGGDDTMNLFPEPTRFTTWVSECVTDFTSNFMQIDGITIGRAWATSQPYGHDNFLHSHARYNPENGADLACVYYLDVLEGHPPLEIMDPRPAHKFNMVHRKMADGNIASGFCSIQIKPELFKLAIHPGYLVHGVGTNLLDYPRTSVAMNVNLIHKKGVRKLVLNT
jgi:hypothetical protein